MIIQTYPDLTTLWRGTTERMLFSEDGWDTAHPPRLFSFPNLLTAETAELEADLRWVGFTKARWTRFLKRYIDQDELASWIERSRAAKGPTSLLFRTKTKKGPREHTGGECLIAMSYRPDPPVLTAYSRESEFPQRALLDTIFIHLMAKELRGLDVRVVWQLGGLYTSLMHSIPFLQYFGLLDGILEGNGKASKYLRYVTNHLVKDRDRLKYGPAKRILARWEAIQAGTMEPVPVSMLLPWPGPNGKPYRETETH